MAPDLLAEAHAWLDRAENDLRAADVDLGVSPPLVDDALFHCQQACEKALKAFLVAHGTLFRKTHDLDELLRSCDALEPGIGSAMDPVRDLTVFAWEFRYPGSFDLPSPEEAIAALLVARDCVSRIIARLPTT